MSSSTLRFFWSKIVLACCYCLLLLTAPVFAAEQLARNAGVEETSPSGGAAGWTFDHWTQGEPQSTAGRDETVFHSGKSSLKMTLAQGDDGKLTQAIAVKPDTWYRVAAWVKTHGIPADAKVGANLSIVDAMDTSADLKGDNDWQEIVAWGKTGPEQKEIKVALRLGFYGSLTTGTAWFDDISVTEAEPGAGAKVISFTPPPAAPAAVSETPSSGTAAAAWAWIATLGYVGLAWLCIRQRASLNQRFGAIVEGLSPLTATGPTLGLVLLVVLVKAYWAGAYMGHSYDIGTFSAWAMDMYQRGFAGFYRPDYFADYPPGYITVLWLVGALSNWLHLPYGTPGFLTLLKMPSMLADIAGVVFLLSLGRKDAQTRVLALMTALLWLLNPLAIITSSFWGQVDSIFTLILAASLLMLERRRVVLAASLYAIAVLFKPQALLVGPIALIALLSLRDLPLQLKAVGAAVATFFVLSLPFTISREPLWIFSLYGGTLASYNYLTINAFNLYALFNANWLPNETLLLGVQVGTWAWVLTLTALGAVVYGVIKGQGTGRYLFGAFAIYLLFFVLGPKMHERYLFPAAFVGLTAFVVIGDKRVLWLAIGASLTTFLNTLVTLDILTRLNSTGVPNGNFFMIACSLVNVFLLIQTLRTGYDLFLRGNVVALPEVKAIEPVQPSGEYVAPVIAVEAPIAKVSRRAWMALAGICAIYSVAAFTYLGNGQSPQKFWNPPAAGEWAVFDLGAVQQVGQLQYHHGLGQGEYAVQWSADGQNWVAGKGIIVDNRFAEFRWRKLDVKLPARYLKIGLSTGSLQMNEIALRGAQDEVIALKLSSGPNDATALIDEQDKTVAISTAFNGMYFDEVYHARSAWEILQGIDATENTHPPLGKIIIALGVAIFGMNPFGFRFMGVTFGILMLPVFFGLSRRLFRSENFALLATALLALDFMHFTQTRIATIDTYGVFFILASSYWMLRWMQQEPATQDWKTDIKSLLLCGLMFGLGAASKWIVLYHGVGLAGLYCWNLWRQAKVAQALPPKLPGQRGYGDWVTQSVMWSVLAFIVIPALIYTAAYIPLMKATGQGIAGMLANQTGMYQYHSQLKATHPFSSFWYQWPTMAKPMWYYSGSEWTGPLKVSSISAFGNPVTWYLGTLAFLVAIGWRLYMAWAMASSKAVFQRFAITQSQLFALSFILAAGLTQFLPWALIPRKLVFIYHFFASVPFIILALVWGVQRLQLDNPQRVWAKYLPWGVLAVAAALFIAYFPVISGYPVPRGWVEFISKGPITLYF
ncbi:phospholipid carrier-dependent glycosyltransferase [Chitinibacter bivalviorum]|uniref:Polyprenol-phosphate-mannose--protein mannosyltransferase n=1 Tax=Chitinibacter bivalviorum TaxID=2739434 RepID=A0A7H9BMB1_9NEIS|nr:phospholipid carrier-dependent glycosyltransferase [Chitinibacter bivalviorum]QLG89695.1 phospholipid carrier-dependent glycosyltransferase [Chitinibacter bivalviorum]